MLMTTVVSEIDTTSNGPFGNYGKLMSLIIEPVKLFLYENEYS